MSGNFHLTDIISPFIDISMFNIKYLAMYNIQMHAGAISKSLPGFAGLQVIIHPLKLVNYLPVQTLKQFINFCLVRNNYSDVSYENHNL